MVLLAIGAAMVAPSMASFYRGRMLSSEAKRVLALVHYGQSRAIAEGVLAQEAQLGDWASKIAATGIPRLVIFGGADQINPPDANALVGFAGRTLVIPEAGHLPHVEAARQVNEALTDFIKGVGV